MYEYQVKINIRNDNGAKIHQISLPLLFDNLEPTDTQCVDSLKKCGYFPKNVIMKRKHLKDYYVFIDAYDECGVAVLGYLELSREPNELPID